MARKHLGFWTLVDEFAPRGPDGQRFEFVSTAAVIVTFLQSHPDWDGTPLKPQWVLALLLDASARPRTFGWTVTQEGTELRFKPR